MKYQEARKDWRDTAALESALSAPFQTFGGEDLYPGKERKAAALCFGLIQNHPFIDGNKRIGVHLCDVFLELNGIKLDYTDDDLVQLGLSVADGSWEIPDILGWIVRHQVL